MKLHKVQCFNKCFVSADRGRGLGPRNSSVFCFLHTFSDSSQRCLPHTHDIMYHVSVQSLASHEKAHNCFYKKLPTCASPSHPCCSQGWQTTPKSSVQSRKIHPPALFFFLFSFKYIPCVDSRVDFPPPNFSCPLSNSLEFDLRMVTCPSGSIPPSCADENPFTGSFCSEEFIVQGGW